MPELRRRHFALFYEQSGAGADIAWLAPGDNPGSNGRRFRPESVSAWIRATRGDHR